MWSYQHSFRCCLEIRARNVLERLGTRLCPKALLVGVRAPDVANRHDVCLEPEDDQWSQSIVSECFRRANEIFDVHPDHNTFYGDEPSMRDKPENIRKSSVFEAVTEAFSRYDEQHGTVTICGGPHRVEGFYVVPALQMLKEELEKYPRLPAPIECHDFKSETGIVEAAVRKVLSEAVDALKDREPGRFFPLRGDTSGALREAAHRLCYAIGLACVDPLMQDTFEHLNAISERPYESGEAHGEIVFAPPACNLIDRKLTFREPVPLGESRHGRKIIEMSGANLLCVCHGRQGLAGLGSVKDKGADLFRVVFSGRYRWKLYFGSALLMVCNYGVPQVPTERLSEGRFSSNARRVIPGLSAAQCSKLWSNVAAAMSQGHGTMLVVSDAAGEEAERLRNQSLPVEPEIMVPDIVRHVSSIDGAILIDRDCRCFAVGVILDGLATSSGDPSRGARFNSAIRYVETVSHPTLCLVVSEDGHVDMVPALRARIRREEVQRRIDVLKKQTHANFHMTRNWLDEHRFYLTPEQCEIVNTELERLNAELREARELVVVVKEFAPDPEMNESYYEDDEE